MSRNSTSATLAASGSLLALLLPVGPGGGFGGPRLCPCRPRGAPWPGALAAVRGYAVAAVPLAIVSSVALAEQSVRNSQIVALAAASAGSCSASPAGVGAPAIPVNQSRARSAVTGNSAPNVCRSRSCCTLAWPTIRGTPPGPLPNPPSRPRSSFRSCSSTPSRKGPPCARSSAVVRDDRQRLFDHGSVGGLALAKRGAAAPGGHGDPGLFRGALKRLQRLFEINLGVFVEISDPRQLWRSLAVP